MAVPSRKRSGNQAVRSWVQPMKASRRAASPAQLSAVAPLPKRRDRKGMHGAETTMPRGVIAAETPISVEDVPWRSRMRLSSG